MKALLVLAALVSLIGCVTNPKDQFPTEHVKRYDLQYDPKILVSKNVTLTNFAFGSRQITFAVTNNTKDTIKILWDESVITLPNGSVAKILPAGVKFADAGRSIPPAVIPSKASIDTLVSRADNLKFLGASGWSVEPFIPCGDNVEVHLTKCDPNLLEGKTLGFILALETNGKKSEYKFAAKLVKNPAYDKWVAEREAAAAKFEASKNTGATKAP